MNRTTATKTFLTAFGIAAAALVLTACSAGGADPDASPTSTAAPKGVSVEYGKCIDGTLTVFANETKATGVVPVDPCASVAIVGTAESGVTYTVGKTDKLVVEGTGLTVSVESAGTIVVPGSNNTITHDGAAEVQDLGAGNTVTKG
ncbi:DUF3060 domain-containing protein [Curtobacterium sp. YR515]|uniref:DUF3060 domain-containing protein n=1 Tax=Curtobacterium sp. YR515 TaxID=1855316 RepID=UPI0008F2A568|nr:DUF3060 domain-containing protein [Curtobacterium sp. YR515]SFF44432.1 Protein of unknown function [Curtobacterium sp. YR515]